MQKFLYVLPIRLINIHEHSFLQHVDLREVTVQHQLLSATLNNVKLTLILIIFSSYISKGASVVLCYGQ